MSKKSSSSSKSLKHKISKTEKYQKKSNKISIAVDTIMSLRNKIKLPNNIKDIMLQKTETSVDFALRSLHHALTATSLLLQASKEATETHSFKETSDKITTAIKSIKDALLDWKSFMSSMSRISNRAFDFFRNLSITSVTETLLTVAEKSGEFLATQLSNVTEAVFSKKTTEQLKITANLFTNLLKNLFQISKRLIGHVLQFVSGIASTICEVIYDVFEYSFGTYRNKVDLSEIFSNLSTSIVGKFKSVLSNSSESFKSFPGIYTYLIGTSMLTSPAIYAGGIPLFYRFLFPVLGGLVTKIYAELGTNTELPLIGNPLKFLSSL